MLRKHTPRLFLCFYYFRFCKLFSARGTGKRPLKLVELLSSSVAGWQSRMPGKVKRFSRSPKRSTAASRSRPRPSRSPSRSKSPSAGGRNPTRRTGTSKAKLRRIFNALDKDGSGFLEVDEIHAALHDLDSEAHAEAQGGDGATAAGAPAAALLRTPSRTDAQVEEMMLEADADDDGEFHVTTTVSTPTPTPLNLLAYDGRLAPCSTLYRSYRSGLSCSAYVRTTYVYQCTRTRRSTTCSSLSPPLLLSYSAPRRCGPFRTCYSLSLSHTTFTLLRPAFPTPRCGDAGRVSFEEFVAVVQISKTWKLVEAGYLDTLFNVINHIAAPVQHAVRTNTVVEIVQIGEGAYVCVCVGSCVCGWVCTMECTCTYERVRVCGRTRARTRVRVRDRACVCGRLRSGKADPVSLSHACLLQSTAPACTRTTVPLIP